MPVELRAVRIARRALHKRRYQILGLMAWAEAEPAITPGTCRYGIASFRIEAYHLDLIDRLPMDRVELASKAVPDLERARGALGRRARAADHRRTLANVELEAPSHDRPDMFGHSSEVKEAALADSGSSHALGGAPTRLPDERKETVIEFENDTGRGMVLD